MPIFCQKNVNSLKNNTAVMPIFCQKNLSSLKNTALPCLFFLQIFHKNPMLQAQIWSNKSQFCQNDTILWAKTIKKMPFFSDFARKYHSSHTHFCQKNVNSLKNTMHSYPNFVKKTSILPKSRCSHDIFSIFHEKPPDVMPLFGAKKRQFSQHNIIFLG